MNVRPATLLLGVGALVITACSTTALSSAPAPETSPPAVSVPPLPDEAPEELVRPDDESEVDESEVDDTEIDDTEIDDTEIDEMSADESVDGEPATIDSVEADEGETTEADAATIDSVEADAESVETIEIAFVRDVGTVAPLDPPLPAIGTSSGSETARLQERLLELGFWVQSVDGTYGLTTRQAVMAFQKYLGLEADGVVGETTAAYLSELTERPHGRADAGTLIEIDKTRQLLFLVIDGRAEWILNASTGTEIPYERPNANNPDIIERGSSITPTGLHQVNRQHEDGWREGDLGEIYRPKYFIGGVAVHGSNSIPNYPASHGCVRVSVPAMDWIWENEFMPMNAPVWVHGEIPG